MRNPITDGERDIDWEHARSQLDERGFVLIPGVLTKNSCKEIAGYYAEDHRFRSRIEMSRYSFGQGEYKYFNYPLPEIVQQLRASIYPQLAPLANQWSERLGGKTARYPDKLTDFLEQCHSAGQKRATPLLLKYGAGDFNCLHQDLYGDIVFPFQVTLFPESARQRILTAANLSLPSNNHAANPALRCSLPSRATAVIFLVHHRPVRGARGYYRANLRHGVSTVRSGERYTLGIIFHDAK